MKNTEGKWHAVREGNRIGVVDSDYNTIVEISANRDYSENYANAKLIAAAPELLEALQNLENDNNSIPAHAWEMVQKAIKKGSN